MKKILKALWILALCLLVSCQEEESTVEVSAGTLHFDSGLTTLLKRVAMSETSIDNALDSTNCYEIQMPFSVSFSGQSYQITHPLDYDQFADIPDGLYDGPVFPLTLIRPDHSTFIVNNQQEFTDARDCTDVLESINCINFNYPIRIFEYESNNQVTDERVFQSDVQFYEYLNDLGSGVYFGLQYPISAVYGNGDAVEVNSDEELVTAINGASEFCPMYADPQMCLPIYLRPGLISFYGFRSGSFDDENQAMDLTASGPVQTAEDRNGNPDCAVAFNYVNETYLFSQNTTSLNDLSALTISLWYQPSTDLTDYETLLSRGEGLSCPDRFGQWSVGLYDNRRAVFGRNNSAWSGVLSQQNTWYHLAAVWSESGNSMSIYMDGVLQQTVSGNAGCMGGVTVEDIGDLIIGRNYTGKIDDVALYNRALSAGEISALHQLPACCQ